MRRRIQDTIALYGGSSNSTMLGEIGTQKDTMAGPIISRDRFNINAIDTDQARAQSIREYRDVLLEQARLTIDPDRIQYLGALLQELRQVAIDNGLEVNERPLDVANNSKLSIQTNPSDPYNIERRREIVREQIRSEVDQSLDLKNKETDLIKYGSDNKNKIIEIKSKIISIYNKYHIAGIRRLF